MQYCISPRRSLIPVSTHSDFHACETFMRESRIQWWRCFATERASLD